MDITVLCKVVDNFGDIGVTWRLCKSIIENQELVSDSLQINLIVDDLVSFSKINDKVNASENYQKIEGINIYYWKAGDFCYQEFSKNDGEKLSFILECFQCGRPEWMEKILFEDKLQRTVHILMIDYLTAEKYAEDFHCLESLTRSKKVQKVNFMPGFTNKTGGLIIDKNWKKMGKYNPEGSVLFFTYERDWSCVMKALSDYLKAENKKLLVAQGRGKETAVKAINECCFDEQLYSCLDYLNQEEWDSVMQSCSVLFIRGEESMSRACLSGIPFVWHAYPQSDEYQLVKVNALLERMSVHFSSDLFQIVKDLWLDFNSNENDVSPVQLKNHTESFFKAVPALVPGFQGFAKSLYENGDLATNLLKYIEKLRTGLF